MRRELDGHEERNALLSEQIAGVRTEARSITERFDERLIAVDQRAQALRSELGAGRERLDAVGIHVERLGADAVGLRTEIVQVRDTNDVTARGLDLLRAELATVREEAKFGDAKLERMQSELTFALKSLEQLKQGLSVAGEAALLARREAEQARKLVGDGSGDRVNDVFQQILGMAAQRNSARAPSGSCARGGRPRAVEREPRTGFDDATTPMAVLTLDGKFRELNPAFTKLVGYRSSSSRRPPGRRRTTAATTRTRPTRSRCSARASSASSRSRARTCTGRA